MQGQSRDGRTLAREAYFLDFARDIRTVARMPLMITGGIRRRAVADHVLDSGIDMVGIGTALAIDPHLPRDWRLGQEARPNFRRSHGRTRPWLRSRTWPSSNSNCGD